ncbi:MAG: hypothetical protein K7J46_03430 [Bryobacter sp.]|jgi:hypothetical protein|nr:hypothetical protein [Bryobacter sp. CoA8 C33]
MMTRRAAIAMGALCAVAAYADTPMTNLRIEVTNDIGKPVDRAGVVVRFIKGRSAAKLGKKVIKSWELRTNSEGWVKIPPIPQGEILIQVIARNYQTYGETFDVSEEERTIQVKLAPPQKQFSSHPDLPAEPKKP